MLTCALFEMDYKDTLNLPHTDFPMKADLVKREPERLKKWESMTVEEKWQEGEGTWSLEAFLHWFRPSERYWYWWDAAVEDPDTLRVSLEIEDWPVPWAALRWLFRAAGALHAESA